MLRSSILIAFILASYASFSAATDSFSANLITLTPMPTPENTKTSKKGVVVASGPISGQAAATGVSLPVRDLPAAIPDADPTPREINPQNSIRLKPQIGPAKAKNISLNATPQKKAARRHKHKR